MDENPQFAALAGTQLFEELMRFLPDGMTANGWAVKAGVSRTIWSDLRRHGNPSRRTLSKLLEAVGSSLAEFEALRVGKAPAPGENEKGLAEGNRGWRGAPPASIPLLATSLAGEWGEKGSGIELHAIDRSRIIGTVDRPRSIAEDSNAYAVTVAGEAMWPRFRVGRRLIVSPASPVSVDDDVLVQLIDGKVLIMELDGRSEELVELRQFEPDAIVRVQSTGIAAIHKIVGEAI